MSSGKVEVIPEWALSNELHSSKMPTVVGVMFPFWMAAGLGFLSWWFFVSVLEDAAMVVMFTLAVQALLIVSCQGEKSLSIAYLLNPSNADSNSVIARKKFADLKKPDFKRATYIVDERLKMYVKGLMKAGYVNTAQMIEHEYSIKRKAVGYTMYGSPYEYPPHFANSTSFIDIVHVKDAYEKDVKTIRRKNKYFKNVRLTGKVRLSELTSDIETFNKVFPSCQFAEHSVAQRVYNRLNDLKAA